MARVRFGRPISLRWNGLLLEGPANTVFEIPDEFYEEFNQDIGTVEPTIDWLDPDEGFSLRTRVTLLEENASVVSASLVDFKGDLITGTADDTVARLGVGTNGQVLTANSATATGLQWQTPSVDIPVSTVNSKGDLIVGTANDAVARFGAGSNGQILTADSGQAEGLVWTTPSVAISLGSSTPLALGTAAAGIAATSSHEDHIHPSTGLALSGHNHTGVYDASGTASSSVSSHEAAADPHPGYLTSTEGNSAYSATGHDHSGVYSATGHNHSGVYDAAGTAAAAVSAHNHSGTYDPAGTAASEAASAVSTHAGLSDPHPGYLTPTEGNAAYSGIAHAHSINDLSDVTVSSPINGQTLLYDGATSQWVNTTSSGGDEFLSYLYF